MSCSGWPRPDAGSMGGTYSTFAARQRAKLRVGQGAVPPQAHGCYQRWWKSKAPESPPNGICAWAASCAADPGVAVT
jgi:hypothetical protein